jgi:hypothetical protein
MLGCPHVSLFGSSPQVSPQPPMKCQYEARTILQLNANAQICFVGLQHRLSINKEHVWLVVWNIFYFFHNIWDNPSY